MIARLPAGGILLALLAARLAPGAESPRQVLEYHLQVRERGSVFAQAKLDGFDYRPRLRKAIVGDRTALLALFEYTDRGQLMGAGSIDHGTILQALLEHLGDDLFSTTLAKAGERVRWRVGWHLDQSFGNGDPAKRYPKTFKLTRAARRPEPAS